MSVIPSFATPVYINPTAVSHADALAIRAFIRYHYRQHGSDRADENLFDSLLAKELCPQLAVARSAANRAFSALLGASGQHTLDFHIASCKYNVMSRGEHRPIHMHGGIDAFAILYLDDLSRQDGGQLVLHNPNFVDSIFTPSNSTLITPSTGLIVAAPAYLWHSVNPYYGADERVCLVVNVNVDAQ